MTKPIVEVHNVSKYYRLGQFGAGSLRDELGEWWEAVRHGRESKRLRDRREKRGFYALKDLSFSVQPGEVVGLIGRNGAGKSTALKLLSRITEPTAGEIILRGRVGSLLEVGTGFHNELSGRDNIYLNGAILGMDRREVSKKFDEIVDFSECERFIDTPVKRYSSGMRVRLAFAVAAHLEPEILIVDEVLAVGDLQFQEKCLNKMDNVAGHGRTVFFVSHNMGMIRQLCRRALVLHKGELQYDGEVGDSISYYVSMMKANTAQAFAMDNPHRSGTGAVRFRGGHIETADGTQVAELISGEPARFCFTYENLENVEKADFSLAIHNDSEVAVTHTNSLITEGAPFDLQRTGEVVCQLDDTPLPPGGYRVGVICFAAGRMVDLIPNAFTFRVHGSRFYATGKTPNPKWCTALVRCSWQAHREAVVGKPQMESLDSR